MTDDRDRIRTAGVVDHARLTENRVRDTSFVMFTVLPDANADDPDVPDVLFKEVNYSWLMNIYYVEFIENLENNVRRPYLLVRIKMCRGMNSLDAVLPENPTVTYCSLSTPDIFHIDTVNAVVRPIPVNNTWGIIDRSRSGARTQFVEDNGDDDN
ncbi:hypothetical protein FRC06_004487 [Ceratobasidium sp. 370]|nr:hypothetical protein FRC06_004487 [Ceratobasidium sp. 370]